MIKINCKRCQNQWIPRTDNPKYCPICKSPSWNKERLEKKPKQDKYTKYAKYGFSSIPVGGAKFIPFFCDGEDRRDNLASSLRQYARRNNWVVRYETASRPGFYGLIVTRSA